MSRILVTNFHPRGGGGHVPYIVFLTEKFSRSGNVVGVAAPEASQVFRVLSEKSYPYLYSFDFPRFSYSTLSPALKSISSFRKIVAEFQPDIVHTNGGDLYTVLWGFPFSRRFRIIRTHHAVRSIPNDAFHRAIYRKSVACNIFVSHSSMDLCLESGIGLPNSVVIENGIDTDLYKPVPKDVHLAGEIGIDDDTFCFGSCAGTSPYKRVDVIIEAARKIQTERKHAILVLGDEDYGRQLEKSAGEHGKVRFIYCGFHRNVIPYVSLFDVGFVLSDSVETISFAAREMMAMGKPLISSSFSGLRENITENVNGFLVKPGDVDGVATTMKRFLEMTPTQLKQFSTQAREKALKSFGIDTMIREHEEVYAEVVANQGSLCT